MIERSLALSPTTSRLISSGHVTRMVTAIFFLALGLIFITRGITDPERLALTVVLGFCFFAYGGFSLLQALRLRKTGNCS
jgi:hypothetical protein